MTHAGLRGASRAYRLDALPALLRGRGAVLELGRPPPGEVRAANPRIF